MKHLRLTLFLCASVFSLIPYAVMAQPPTAIAPVAAAPPSPFEQTLAYVYQQNPQLVTERENLQIDDEHVSQAYAGFRPDVSVTGGLGRQREAVQGQDWLYGPSANGSLVATQPIFNGFGTLEQYHAAKARVEAGRARLLATEQRILFETIGVWLDLCEKEKIRDFNLDNLGRMYTYMDATKTRFKAGDGTQTDIAQSESRLAEAEARYAGAQADWEVAGAHYERVTGLRPPVVHFPPYLGNLPRQPTDAETLAHDNPEMQQVDSEEVAAQHDIDTASSSIWPSVYLQGEMDEQRSPDLGLARLRDDSLTVNIKIPLYQGGAEYSRVREARITHEKARQAKIDTLRDVVERARQAWYNYYAACLVINAAREASEASARALAGVQQEQSQGMRSTLDVLNAQSEMLSTQIAEVQAEKNVRLEGYRLLASTGQLTAKGLHLPTAMYDPRPHYDDTATRAIGF